MVSPSHLGDLGTSAKDVLTGAALGVLRIAMSVSTAVGTSFAARGLWQDDTLVYSCSIVCTPRKQ